ncbi:MAG: DUF2284 domain-containing protein [Desulfocapsaceae bacterium]|nr:DUF2284 domain-containing protein [Desulfocapsaceae bacterium]
MVERPDILIAVAKQAGASDARFVVPEKLVVDENFAAYCKEPGCPNYGLSLSCPPHVSGPRVMREWLAETEYALAVKMEVPKSVLHSVERLEVMRLLHEIVAEVEHKAVSLGFQQSKSFAGGSCKVLFCGEHGNCQTLSGKQQCRNPRSARPSMSGFGVDVASMMKMAGWDSRPLADSEGEDDAMSWVAGLVLVCL